MKKVYIIPAIILVIGLCMIIFTPPIMNSVGSERQSICSSEDHRVLGCKIGKIRISTIDDVKYDYTSLVIKFIGVMLVPTSLVIYVLLKKKKSISSKKIK